MKKKFTIILLILISIILLLVTYSVFKRSYISKNDKNINTTINEFENNKEEYVFVEINPKLLLVIENNKVNRVYCMNHDCTNFYSDIHVKNLDTIDAINEIYILVNKKGFDTSKGVKIKSTTYIPIENHDYNFIEIEYIKEEQKNILLKDVLNYEFSNDDDNNYYNNLIDKLKEDSDYDKYYTCSIEEKKCNFIMSSINKKFDLETVDVLDIDSLFSNRNTVLRILKKFNFNIDKEYVKVNNINYSYSISYTDNGTDYNNVLYREVREKLSTELCSYIDNPNCMLDTGIEIIKLSDLNLLEPVITSEDIIPISYGIKENIVEIYNIEHKYEIEKAEEDEKIKNECISKGYHLENKTYCDEDGCMTQDMWCRQESNSFISCRINCGDIN